jgi:uncharacterized membrane protein
MEKKLIQEIKRIKELSNINEGSINETLLSDIKHFFEIASDKILETDIKNIDTLIQNNKKILILVVNDIPKNDENVSIDSIVENLNKMFKNHIDLNNVTIQVIPKISEILYEKNYKISSNLIREQIFYIIKAFSWRAVGTLDTIFLAWLITKDPLTGLTIGAAEFITKTVLYYFHDLLWDKCIRHLKCCKR